ALLDCLERVGSSKVHLVDCDTSNPDIWKTYRNKLGAELINLDEADGCIELVNTCDEHSESIVVINTAARNNGAVSEFGATLNGSLEELRRRLIALWDQSATGCAGAFEGFYDNN